MTEQNNGLSDLAIAVPRNDPDMELAFLDARRTIEQFIRHVQNPTATQGFFAVKVKLSVGDRDEYIWINDVTYDGRIFVGHTGNKTDFLPELSLGDEYKVSQGDICDWMFVEQGKLMGGYTIRAARDKMTPENRKLLDASLWFAVE